MPGSLRWFSALVAALLVVTLTACGGSEGGSSDKVVDSVAVTISDGTIEPGGKRLDIARNKPFTFKIDSDVSGEIHIHSKPEQTVTFEAGQSEHDVTFDKPGIFPAESHDPAKVIVELEVR